MRRLVVAFTVVAAFFLNSHTARASVNVHIDKSQQRMTVSVDGKPRYSWAVSTGRRGFGTPSGVYRPQMMARRWFSRKYYNSPMPYSIFFHRGYAIHGSYEIRRLGGPASHGCVRLHPIHAATLYGLVQKHGTGETRIVVSGAIRVAEASKPVRPRMQPEPVQYRYEPTVSYRPVYRPPVYEAPVYYAPVYYPPAYYYYYR